MNRFISVMCVCCTLFFSFSNAFVKREMDIVCEKVIPFNFTSDTSDIEEYISLKEYNNVKIIDYYIDNGDIEVIQEDDLAVIMLSNGEHVKGNKIVTKTKSMLIEDVLEDEKKRTIIKDIKENIKEIHEVNGDFKNAKLVDDNTIEITINEDAKGNIEQSKDETIVSEIKVEVLESNTEKEVYTDYYELLYEPINIDLIKVNNGQADVEIKDNKLRVFFSDGSPKLNETIKTDGYTYFWADRAVDGTFKREYPNSVYRSDRKYFTGEGEYIEGDKAVEQLAYEVKREDEWIDYTGVIIDGVKYMYVYDENKEVTELTDRIILSENKLSLCGQWCNTEQLDIEFDEDLIRYIPNGKLYSIGDLVKNTTGWGEVAPNQEYESTEEFFNELTGKYETYVKHFKFFYGPKEKLTFGGYFTYPYSATVKYEHYKPVTVYSGNVVYTYEEEEDCDGYNYNGWIKISYPDIKSINDYPPKAPYNVHYNDKILWNPGSDDYTSQNELVYEVEVNIDEVWQSLGVTEQGEIEKEYSVGDNFSYRVRTLDETGQVSDWAYSGENEITLNGSIEPQVIRKGEPIDISAFTKSLTNIVKVEAECEELEIKEELTKISEIVPNFEEMSFELCGNFAKNSYINTKNDMWSYNDEDKLVVKSYESEALTDEDTLEIKLPYIKEIGESGTVIIPNQNYLGTPMGFFRLNDDWWHLKSSVALKMKSSTVNRSENFIRFINDTSYTTVDGYKTLKLRPYISLNTFSYGDDNKVKYIKIPIDTNIAHEPISVIWKTNDGITSFNIYFGDTLVYVHNVEFENIKNNIQGFRSYDIGKKIYRVDKTTSGWAYDTSDVVHPWPELKRAGDLLDMPWLGYKLKSNLVNEEKLKEYNNLSTTREVNRILFLDKPVKLSTIKKYLGLIKNTNISLSKRNDETIFGNLVRERECSFLVKGVLTNPNVVGGNYEVKITAYDEEDNVAFIKLPIQVLEEQEFNSNQMISIGRFYYDESKNGLVEELRKLKKDGLSEGFISAGETLALLIEETDAEFFIIDIEGDESVKTFDNLTKRFLEEEPDLSDEEKMELIEKYNMPLIIYPSNSDNNFNNFVWLYKIPYRTAQSLESWATLREKSGDSENIDKNMLFDRILEPYELVIRKNGEDSEEIKIKFDVFERWDTVLNRDVSTYLSNYLTKWRKEI